MKIPYRHCFFSGHQKHLLYLDICYTKKAIRHGTMVRQTKQRLIFYVRGKKILIKNTKKGSRIFILFPFLPHVLSLSKWIENCLFKHVPPLSVFSFMWPHTQTPQSPQILYRNSPCECTNNIPCRWQSVILTRTSKCALRTAENIDPYVLNKSL